MKSTETKERLLQWLRGAILRSTFFYFINQYVCVRKFIGGVWKGFWVVDGQVHIWEFVPEAQVGFYQLPSDAHAVQTEVYPNRVISTGN